jgi:hypothetical protein
MKAPMNATNTHTSMTGLYIRLFIFFFITYAYFFQGGGWTENTRICLTRAILHEQTFIIDSYKEDSQDPPFEFVNTGDWAFREGHYYTNKSPGLSILAIPGYALGEKIMRRIYPNNPEKQVWGASYLATISTVGLSGALLCVLMLHMLHHFFGFSRGRSLALVLIFGTGTLIFGYSTAFYCHSVSSFFCMLTLMLLMHIKHKPSKHSGLQAALAGAAASMAVLVEASTLYLMPCFILYLLNCKHGWRLTMFFLAACIPAGLFQLYYNWACFGGPLETSYAHANPAVMVYKNGSLFGWPTIRSLLELTVFPYRGLLVSSPILLMIVPGIVLLFKKKNLRAELFFATAVSLIFLMLIASIHAWYGGSAPGPRYLVPAYPFMFLLTVFAFKKFPRTYAAVALLSICINLAITIVGINIPGDIKFPLKDVVLKNILQGSVSINPVPFAHFDQYPNIYAMADIEQWQPNFNSFNWGEILFPHSLMSILPLLLFWLVWIWLMRRRAG